MSPLFSVTAPRAVRFMLAILAVLLALTVLAVHQTRAQTTITVPDGDVQALITAIEDANSSSGSVTIELASSGDYVLTAPYTGGGQSGGNGLPLISGEIIIAGHGATIRRDPDSDRFRILAISSNGNLHLEALIVSGGKTRESGGGIFVDDNATVEMTGGTINGNEAGIYGGGIYNHGGNLTVTDSSISGNTARTGGIYSHGGDLSVTDSSISGNTARSGGGGIGTVNNATVEMTGTDISGNTALSGGGFYLYGGNLTLTDSSISGNTASSSGGGIVVDNNATVEMTDIDISGNTAQFSCGGICVFDDATTVEITSGTISGNTARRDWGGGIYNSADGEVTLTNSAISGNTAGKEGGGIYNTGNGELTLTNSTVSGNTAGNDAGGIVNFGDLTLANSTVSGNTASNLGGGIYNDVSNLTLTDSTISGNEAGTDGGGIYNSTNGEVTLTNSTVSDNTASSGGGIINDEGGTLELTNSTVSGNTATSVGGGIDNFGDLTLTNSTVSGNTATGPFGGGIINNFGGTLELTNSTVSGNTATSVGGGILNDGDLTLTSSIVADNEATNGPDIDGNVTTDGAYNLISQPSVTGLSGNDNILGEDPLIGILQNNGGPTETHLPLPESPVLNQIPDGANGCGVAGQIDTDQRGVPRPQGTHCDIGAVELASAFAFDHQDHIDNPWFRATWARTDLPVRDGHISRTWMWGPGPFTTSIWEPYTTVAQNPGGDPVFLSGIPESEREVIYFDKAKMEINDPDGDTDSIWFVTNGLLVVEMITGNRQFGDDLFKHYEPSHSNVAGDADDIHGPTYASFQSVLDAPAQPVGTLLTGQIDRSGNVTFSSSWGDYNVTVGHVDDVTDHGIAGPFWQFMNSQGLVHEGGAMFEDDLFENPFYATGRPVTEAYWADVKVAEEQRGVLIQCFERRCLTYTPGNSEGFIVEAGNVGQHYYFWRYIQAPD